MRKQIDPDVIDQVLDTVRKNLYDQLLEKGYGGFISNHEIYGVLAEEMTEYLDAVHANKKDIEKINELSDIAVGAIFGISSIIGGSTEW